MINIITGIFTLIMMTGSAAGFSTLFLKREDYKNLTDYLIFSIALGYGIIGILTLFFSAIKYINLHFFITVIVIGIALFFRNRPGYSPERNKIKINVFLIIILIFLSVNFFYSLFPPTFYDSMMYHLAVPNYYILHGGITPWDTNFNSSLPLNGEMLFLFSFLSGTVFTPKILSFFTGILIVILLTSWYRSGLSGKKHFLPAVLFLTVPQIGFLMSSSKTDIIGMLYLILGIRSFFYYIPKRDTTKFLVLSGVFWGLSIGTKYIFAFYLLGFFISVLFLPQKKLGEKFKIVKKISIVVILCLIPWFGKNILINGNPVYPYMNKYFGSDNWDKTQEENFSTIIKRGEGKTISDYLKFPLKLMTTPYSFGITAVWGFMFLLLLPFSLFHGSKSEGRSLFVTSVVAFSILVPFAMVPRYFLTSLLLISIPISLGIERSQEKLKILKKLITPIIVMISIFNLILLAGLDEKFFHGVSYLSKKYSRSYDGVELKYLYALPYYGGVEYINNHLSDNDKVIFLGEDRTFYMKKFFIASSFNDRNPLLDILKSSESFFEFKMKLQTEGITHIYFTRSGMERMGEVSGIYRIGKEMRDKLENYLLKFTVLYRDKNYTLYKVAGF